MTKAIVTVLAGALLLQSSSLLSARQAREQTVASPSTSRTGTGVMSGVVTSEDGSRPVRFAYLVLLGTATGTVKVSSTDGDGRFTFANLPADRYVVGASKPPYLGTVAGARRPGRSGTPIAVADGQKLSNVSIRMPMGASISGAIVDEKGQPATNTEVTVQQLKMQGGDRVLVPVQGGVRVNSTTDERGRYRLYGLLPGEYVVSALRSQQPGAWPLTVNEVDAALRGARPARAGQPMPQPVRYAPIFFPGTTRAANAVPIALSSGEDRINVDIKLESVQVAVVQGTVVSADGQLVQAGPVSLSSAGQSPLRTVQNTTIREGRFALANVLPGTYSAMALGTGPWTNHFGSATVEVAGADVLGVQLTMRPMLRLEGRIEFRGAGVSPSMAGRRVPVRAVSAVQGAPSLNVSATTEAGAFTIANVLPGAYVIGAPLSFGPTTDSITWALESVIADGRDITDRPFEITTESLPKDLVVTYSDRHQELGGRLSRADGAPISEHTIIVFPEDKAYWVTGSRRIVTTRPGTDGRFNLSGAGPTTLPPGKYLLAAVTDIDRNEQFDPAFLASIAPAAVQLTIQPGERKIQDLIVK